MLRRLGKDLRMANWKASVTLEMRDWVYGTYLPPRLIRIYPGAFKHASMGVAIDLGTTSVVVYLMDFATGRVVDSASAYNKQISCGEDVISRIIYAKRKRGLDHLQKLAVETINDLLGELQQRNGIELYEIHEVTVAGNTTMTHLLLGLDPRHLREEPYIPTISAAPKLNAGELGLHANMLARVHVLPSVGSYVGGDITAGVISTGHVRRRQAHAVHRHRHQRRDGARQQGLAALLRLLGRAGLRGRRRAPRHARHRRRHRGRLRRRRHLRAVVPHRGRRPGRRHLRQRPHRPARRALRHRARRQVRAPRPLGRRRTACACSTACPSTSSAGRSEGGADHDIALTESDITSLIRAKAAIYAGYEVLCSSVGVDLADVEQIFIGGAFGQYINVEKAIRIGLLPDQPPERFHFLGNTSAQGAYAALLCVNIRHDVLDVAAKMTYLELSADNTFMDEYTSALFLPHTDLDVFPTVRDSLARTRAAARAGPTSNGG